MATPEQLSSCTLEGSELLARMHAWQEVASRAISRRVEPTRIIATYPNDGHLLERLRELIDAEADCCPFLEFTLHETPDSIVTELRFSPATPAPMRTAIAQLIGDDH
jgi:hypothetical protein